MPSRLECRVGGDLDDQHRVDVGDRHLPAAEVAVPDLGRPRMIRRRHLGEGSGELGGLLACQPRASAHDLRTPSTV